MGAFAFGMLAVKLYSLPALLGFSGQELTGELDFLCAAASSLLAVTAGVISVKSGLLRRLSIGELIAAVIAWLGFTFFLLLIWGASVLYYAVLLAPTHAFAILSVGACWAACQRERTAVRLNDENER